MQVLFYLHAGIAVLAMGCAMVAAHAIHALLYAIFSLVALAISLYALSAPLASALEVIIYAGAIMVLFVFAVMLLQTPAKEKESTASQRSSIVLALVAFVVFWAELIFALSDGLPDGVVGQQSTLEIATALFGTYGFLVEVISFVLLAGLVSAIFVGDVFIRRRGEVVR